jgi:hypothetical protein
MSNWSVVVCPAVAALVAGSLVYLVFRVRAHHKRVLRRRRSEDPVLCRHCGYDLRGVEIPRCPECGRAMGFDITFAQMGVDERDVIDHVRREQGSSVASRDDAASP